MLDLLLTPGTQIPWYHGSRILLRLLQQHVELEAVAKSSKG